ncbi:MAG TPA: transglycosylase SLT domain-containing protein [Rhodopila sp.]|nr:transglycosylase SLT domain-containing protein [Rhodopila sp.]
MLGLLAACSSQTGRQARYSPHQYYPPPGPPSDPWGPYIKEASARFNFPELWIRKVMRQESGGQQDVISWAGAMGLMQVMPDTYNELRARYDLGADPFDPHNNILAGTAYLKEMYDQYGAPAFLAAYNAGPRRVDRYLNNGTPLPEETVQYVAAIAPQLGSPELMTGPLAAYAGSGGYATRYAYAAPRSTPGVCDPDAAYDPSRPCKAPVMQVAAVTAPAPARFKPGPPASVTGCDPDAAYDPTTKCQPARVQLASLVATPYVPGPPAAATGCDPDAAYDPTRKCQPAPVAVAQAAVDTTEPADVTRAPVIAAGLAAPPPVMAAQPVAPSQRYAPPPSGFLRASAPSGAGMRRPIQEMMTQHASYNPAVAVKAGTAGNWGIQVGAFSTLSSAEAAAQSARAAAPDLLNHANVELPATSPLGTQVAFRARLTGLSQSGAADACSRLSARGMACMTVPPSHS